MDEEIKTVEEQEMTQEEKENALNEMFKSQLTKHQNYGMMVGAQTICHIVLEKIYAFEKTLGSKSTNDYKRLVKDIKKFCEVGVSRKVNVDGTTEPVNQNDVETVQN